MSEGRLLTVEGLSTTFSTAAGDLPAVADVSFDVDSHETLGIVGESGSGKTVLARTIMGLQPRARVTVTGSVLLNGHQMVGVSEAEKRKYWGTEVAMVFQD
ncbi:MAG: ATP-binding cassette domain-containing protein, partial [Acidimicrobiales bacterium]